jgi:hypothetical protein
MKTSMLFFAVPVLAALVACSGGGDQLTGGADPAPNGTTDPNNPNNPGPGPGPGPSPEKTCAEAQTPIVGLGGIGLHSTRAEALAGVDRDRFKPYSSLAAEYKRVMGLATAPDLTRSAQTFGEAPARFYAEPKASAVNLYEAYTVAFKLCETNLTGATYTTAPTATTAATECAAWERKFWSRTPTPAEIDACAKVAVTDSVTETVAAGPRQTTPVRRWSYACASVLSSAGFLTY